jgi:hypothetical protein
MTTHAPSGLDPQAPASARSLGRASSVRATPALGPWVALGVVWVLAVLVFWLFPALPCQDLPAHAGLIAMRHRFAESPLEQRFFVLATGIGPYSLFLVLGEWLDRLLGPLRAERALATFHLLATPAVLLFARRRLHGDRSLTAGFLGIALSFGFMTVLGFASYLFALALALLALTLWLEVLAQADQRRPTWRRELQVGALAAVVVVAHGHAFVVLLALAGMTALATGDRLQRALRARAFVPATALAAWCATRGLPAGSVPHTYMTPGVHFQGPLDKLSLLATPMLMTRTGIDIALGVVTWVAVLASIVATARAGRTGGASSDEATSRTHSRALIVAAAAVLLAFLALPHSIGWFGFVDGRLVPLVLILALLGVRRSALGPDLEAVIDRGAPAVAYAMTALVLVASARFQAEADGYVEVFALVPAGARLLNLPLDPNSDTFTAHPFVHYDKLIAADRAVMLSDVWSYPGSGLYPTAESPTLRLPESYSDSDLRRIDWPSYHLEDWDYALIRTRVGATAPETPEGLALAKHAGGWWLYRTAASPGARL